MKRNIGKHTPAQLQRQRILAALPERSQHWRSPPSALGFTALPDYNFKNPQGAAFAVAKLLCSMREEGLIGLDLCDDGPRGYYITAKGREQMLNRELPSEHAKAIEV